MRSLRPLRSTARRSSQAAASASRWRPRTALIPAVLMKNAELALYRAKAQGRGCARFFEAGMEEDARVRADLETDLRNALANEAMDVYFQPLVNTRTRKSSGLRDAAALEPARPRAGLAGRVHLLRRGNRHHRAARRMGDPQGDRGSRAMARRRSRGGQPVRRADAQPVACRHGRQRACRLAAGPEPPGNRDRRERPDGRDRAQHPHARMRCGSWA